MFPLLSFPYHNRDKRVLVLLMQFLCLHINARQPASIAWMAVVPPNDGFPTIDLLRVLLIGDKVSIGFRPGIHSSLGALKGEQGINRG